MPSRTSRRASDARRILNCQPSRNTEDDWTFGTAVLAGVAGTALPETADLRADWWTIGDQGASGSCVGWATADAVLRWHFVRAGWIGDSDLLSVRFSWMASKETDEFTSAATTFIEAEGTSLKAALDIARRYGSVLDEDLPFAANRLFPGSAEVFYAKAARLKIASYINLEPSLTSWRRWIANNGPILARLDVDRTWFDVGSDGRLAHYQAETASGGHAVALVGYDRDGFIVRNSWGEGWGREGFAFASNAYAATAFTETYGVTLPTPGVTPGVARPAASAALKSAGVMGRDAAVERTSGALADAAESLQALVMQAAYRTSRRRDFGLSDAVGVRFPTLQAVNALLGAIQRALRVGMILADASTAEKMGLARGSYFALVDWVSRRLTSANPELAQ